MDCGDELVDRENKTPKKDNFGRSVFSIVTISDVAHYSTVIKLILIELSGGQIYRY